MHIQINDRKVGPGHPTYVIAEMSANHGGSLAHALEIVYAAKAAGADAIKLQTYTPDTMTIDCDREPFRIPSANTWGDQRLYDLYRQAYTPWEWQAEIKQKAEAVGLDCFSTPFDPTAVDFLAGMDVPAYKIASFELVDIPLVRLIARQGKPIILSTGLSTLEEVDTAVKAIRTEGNSQIALLKCNSAYPAPAAEMHLRTIPHMRDLFGVPVGLSDHTMGWTIAVAAVALGACIVEKHFTLTRTEAGPDSSFSMEPAEFEAMVSAIRAAEAALGEVRYEPSEGELSNRLFRRSLFVVADVAAGETFTEASVRSIRPSHGLPPIHLDDVLGRKASRSIQRGTPLSWDLIA